MHGKAQGHDVCVMFRELQGGSILWQEVQVHAEEIHGEFPVEVMEFVFIFTVILIQMFFINPGEIMQIERTLWIDALVDAEEPPVLFGDKGMPTVRAHETDWRGNKLPRDERLATDLALILPVAAIIIIEIVVGSATEWTDGILGNGFPIAPLDRPDGFAIFPEVVFQEELPVLFEEGLDDGEAVSVEFLVFRGVWIIEGPLLERDISADKVQEPANRFILFLNYSK